MLPAYKAILDENRVDSNRNELRYDELHIRRRTAWLDLKLLPGCMAQAVRTAGALGLQAARRRRAPPRGRRAEHRA